MTNKERCRNRSRMWFESASTSFFFFFLLFLRNFTKSFQCWKFEPLPLAPSRLFIGNERTWLICSSPKQAVASTWSNLARPSELVTSPLSHLGAQVSQRLAWASQGFEKASKWPFSPPFWVLSTFFTETSKNISYCVTTGVKQLNSASKNQNFSKWSSPDEIKVWQKSNLAS